MNRISIQRYSIYNSNGNYVQIKLKGKDQDIPSDVTNLHKKSMTTPTLILTVRVIKKVSMSR